MNQIMMKLKKNSGLLKSEEKIKKMEAKFNQEAEDAKIELERKAQEERERIIREKEKVRRNISRRRVHWVLHSNSSLRSLAHFARRRK